MSGIPFPGFFERIHDDAKNVLSLDVFDGFRLDITKPVGERLALLHSIWLGTSLVPGGTFYNFGANTVLGPDVNY